MGTTTIRKQKHKQHKQHEQKHEQQQRSCLKCCIITFLLLGCISIIGFVTWHLCGQPTVEDAKAFLSQGINGVSDFTNVLSNGDIEDMDWGDLHDPYFVSGDNTTSQHVWKTHGRGLNLEIRNALDESWQNEYDAVIRDYKIGVGDVLSLETKRVDVNHACDQPIDGIMLVCNGNYGPTGWVGINELEYEIMDESESSGFIVSSIAKMNEYYLHNANYEQRQYTMCHEIGMLYI